MAPNHESTVHSFLTRGGYRNVQATKADIMNALRQYRGLNPKFEKFIFENGRCRDLICLRGTIPVTYRGNTYNIPVGFWILDTHPMHAPMCYVIPTPEMQIKVSSNVDHNGKIYLPYLHDWKQGVSDILGLIQICIIVFGDLPPVFSRHPNQPQQPPPPPPVPSMNRFMAPQGYPSTPYPPVSSASPYPPAYPPPPPANYNPPGGQPPYMSMPQPAQPAYPPTFSSSGPDPTGTITQEHLKASLLSAVEDKIRRSLREEFTTRQVEIQSLAKMRDEMLSGQEKLKSAVRSLDGEISMLQSECSDMANEKERLSKSLASIETAGETVDPDEAITTTTPLYRQLLNAFAEEAAIEDAIYYLGDALRHNVIDCDTFLKHVRNLSRKQFFLRATMKECRRVAGLPA